MAIGPGRLSHQARQSSGDCRRPRRTGLGRAADHHRRPEGRRPGRERPTRSSRPPSTTSRQRGGGTVHILPGTYRLRNAIYLSSRVRLKGSGPETILIKEPSITTKLAADSDWYDQEITLADAAGSGSATASACRAKNPTTAVEVVLKRTLVARSGNRFKLDRALRENLWLRGSRPPRRSFP